MLSDPTSKGVSLGIVFLICIKVDHVILIIHSEFNCWKNELLKLGSRYLANNLKFHALHSCWQRWLCQLFASGSSIEAILFLRNLKKNNFIDLFSSDLYDGICVQNSMIHGCSDNCDFYSDLIMQFLKLLPLNQVE